MTSTFQKIKFALGVTAALGAGIFYFGWAHPGEAHRGTGVVTGMRGETVTVTRNGQRMPSYDQVVYSINVAELGETISFTEPTPVAPRLSEGQSVEITWQQRGLFGSAFVTKAE